MIKSCIILAAGLGTRMRPLTDNMCKPMVTIMDKPLIAYVIDMVLQAGCDNIVMNVHYKPDSLVAYIDKYYAGRVIISDEREKLLDSGGGIVKALKDIHNPDFFVVNADCIWHSSHNALLQLSDMYNPDMMDIVKLLYPAENAIGFDSKNIYAVDANHHIIPHNLIPHRQNPDYAFTGIQIMKKSLFVGYKLETFSVRQIWDTAFAHHKIFGCLYQGDWLHIGTPDGVIQAQNFFKNI